LFAASKNEIDHDGNNQNGQAKGYPSAAEEFDDLIKTSF
jgi:hypothetical protein